MANEFYNATGTPATASQLASAPVRSEYATIGAGFDKMPALSGRAGTAVVVNGTGTALGNTVGGLALAGNFATIGAFNTVFVQQSSISITLPLTADTLVGRATTDTLTNKTLTAPVMTAPVLGTPASGTLTNCTGYTAANLSGLGAGVGTFLATPSSANLAAAVTDETGTGPLVFASGPTLTNPIVGTQSVGDNSTKAASTAYVDGQSASGTYTPIDASGAALIFTSPAGFYRKTLGFVHVWGTVTYPVTADGAEAKISLPFTSANLAIGSDGFQGVVKFSGGLGTPGGAGSTPNWCLVNPGAANLSMKYAGGTIITNALLGSPYGVRFYVCYPI